MRLPSPAVFGRIVQDVQEHLAHPFGVAGDLRNVAVVLHHPECYALLTQAAAVHIHRILKLRPDICHLHIQGHASVFHSGEVQELCHHLPSAGGSPAG